MKKACEAVQSRGKRRCSVMLVCIVTAVLFIYNWNQEAVRETHTIPQEEKVNIYTWVRNQKLPRAQIRIVSEQTGVQEAVVSKLLREGKWQQLLELQGAYFAPVQTCSLPSSIVTVSEYVVNETGRYVDGTHLADVQEGDILITKNSRFLGWRNGHAGLVVDAKEGLVLEAIMLGTDTKLCSIEKWTGYPAFQVLRLKEGAERAKQVAVYAEKNLVGVPYQLLAGVKSRLFVKKESEGGVSERKVSCVLEGTQCAHLVWYAYMQAGIDLDSDGGFLVTPTDIQKSPLLEVVQSYGY